MSNYIKLVQSQAELTSFKTSNDFITPSLLAVHNSRIVDYNQYIPPHDYSQDYLTFVAQESGTFTFTNSINYSIDDGETWASLSANTNTPTINAGDKILWKATLTPNFGIGKFSSTGQFNAQGNVMSLLYGDNFIGQTNLTGKKDAFYYLFNKNTNILSAQHLSLPATTLAVQCYGYMFNGCTSLTTAPSLPATTLTYNCYRNMFQDCTSLTTAPELPATTLESYCYSGMFMGCTSLTVAPALPAMTLSYDCYDSMFYGCTSLTTAPVLSATTLANYCYQSMFNGCTSLTTAPVLPATTLASGCYSHMFEGCTKLTNLPVFSGVTLASNCCSAMFYNCSALTTIPSNYFSTVITLASSCFGGMFNGCTKLTNIVFPSINILANNCYKSMYQSCTSLTDLSSYTLPGTTLASHCYDSTFYGCNNITVSPILPATTMAEYCYQNMFDSCTSLTIAPELPATTLASNCYVRMFHGCTSLTTAPALPATTLTTGCYNSMFQGCTNLSNITCLATDISATYCLTNWVSGIATSGTFKRKNSMVNFNIGNNGIPIDWVIIEESQQTYQYKWEVSGIACSDYNKCKVILYKVSNNYGETWETVMPEQTQYIVIEYNSVDCGYPAPISIVSTEYELPTEYSFNVNLSRPISESEYGGSIMSYLAIVVHYYTSNIDEQSSSYSEDTLYFGLPDGDNSNGWIARKDYTYEYYEYNYETDEYEVSYTEERSAVYKIERWSGEIEGFVVYHDDEYYNNEISDIYFSI